jgi:hypothetical protein
VVIEVLDVGSWAIVALAFLVLPLASRPSVQRLAVALAERTEEWAKARGAAKDRLDPEQEKLWQWTKRRRLCAAVDRIERLIATDAWMSATRQLGNRLAYRQLVDELRRTPDVFPTSLDAPVVDLWADPIVRPGKKVRRQHVVSTGQRRGRDVAMDRELPVTGYIAQPGEVEILEIGGSGRRAFFR